MDRLINKELSDKIVSSMEKAGKSVFNTLGRRPTKTTYIHKTGEIIFQLNDPLNYIKKSYKECLQK